MEHDVIVSFYFICGTSHSFCMVTSCYIKQMKIIFRISEVFIILNRYTDMDGVVKSANKKDFFLIQKPSKYFVLRHFRYGLKVIMIYASNAS